MPDHDYDVYYADFERSRQVGHRCLGRLLVGRPESMDALASDLRDRLGCVTVPHGSPNPHLQAQTPASGERRDPAPTPSAAPAPWPRFDARPW